MKELKNTTLSTTIYNTDDYFISCDNTIHDNQFTKLVLEGTYLDAPLEFFKMVIPLAK